MADALAEMAASSEEPLPDHTPAPVVSLVESVRETTELPALASEANSEFSGAPTDASSNNASFSSTPPTTMTDAASIASDTCRPDITTATLTPLDPPEEKVEQTVEVGTPHPDIPEPQPSASEEKENLTPRRVRASRSTTGTPVYNLAKLAGTYIHGKRRANGDDVREKRRRTTAGDVLGAHSNAGVDSAVQRGSETPDVNRSLSASGSPKSKAAAKSKKEKDALAAEARRATRSSGVADTTIVAVSPLGKRSRKAAENTRIPRELRRLQDTNEFVGIEKKPVLHTIWSNGKYVDPNDLDEDGEPLRKKARKNAGKSADQEELQPDAEAEASEEATPIAPTKQKRVKKWLQKGLYAGQDTPADYTTGLSTADKKKLAQLPELASSGNVNKALPLPMFAGLRLLINGRDFKLPYDVCNPLPPGQPKPDEWRKMTKNRFVGDAGTYWRKTDHFKDYQSKCICKPEDGCAEDCQNRIMLYECDDTNCNAGKEHCQNRAFQNLTERTKKGGRYRVGVEVVKTSDRGYGVRSNRCFEPNQIIMEYTGEIITEAECERRMNEKYKDNECYYLMAFDQNMIIDATTGSIARFVNHSCDPNCRMEKWIVHGQPRMALFAGEKPIMTGDELTYDYNFDPFSAKNVQKCLCGSANCRGVLGPKVSKVAKAEPKSIKETIKTVAKAGKRKLKALLGGEEAATNPSKKRKITKATGVKKSLSAKATAAAMKKTAISVSVNAKAALSAAQAKKPVASVSVRKATLVKASKVYNKNGKQLMLADSIVSNSTIVASSKGAAAGRKTAAGRKMAAAAKKVSPTKGKTTGKTAGKGTIKASGGKGSIRSTVKSAKHTISKAGGKKTTVKRTKMAKKSVLASPDSVKVTRKYGKKDRSIAAAGGSISVKDPRNALELSRTENKICVATGSE